MAKKVTKKERKTEANVKKSSAQGPVLVDSLFGRTSVSAPKDTSEYLKLYSSMPWVYACVYSIATSGAALPLRVFRKIEGEAQETATDDKNMGETDDAEIVQPRGTPSGWEDVTDEPDDHWIVKVLADPNPMMSTYDLLETTLGYMELAGDMYWELAEMKNGLPGQIYPIRPTRMKQNMTRNTPTQISSYTFKVNNRSVNFSPEEILAFHNFNPTDDFHGQGSVRAATDPLLLEQEATKFNKAFFTNDATPSGVIQTDGEMSDEDYERVTKQWQMRHRGAKQQFKTAILPPGLSFKPIGLSFKDMGFEELKKMNRQEILTVFGVPPVKVGLLEYAKYCLPPTARISTVNGPKHIVDIRPGDEVWSVVDGKLVSNKVTWQSKIGGLPLYTIRTKNRTIVSSDNHPYMVRDFDGKLTYKEAQNIKSGDYVVQPKMLPDVGNDKAPDGSAMTVNRAKFLGMLVGDGTVDRNEIRVAVPENSCIASSYRGYAEESCTKCNGNVVAVKQTKTQFRFSSRDAAAKLTGLGFGCRIKHAVKTKRVPGWVFGLSRELRLGFIAGLVDSDGHIDKRGSMMIGSCSKELALDYRDLLISVGIQCSNLSYREQQAKNIRPYLDNNLISETYDFWSLTASSADRVAEIPFVDGRYRVRVEANAGRFRSDGKQKWCEVADLNSEHLGFYRVVSVEQSGQSDVYDISVENAHNFIADGVVVHNSNYNLQEKAFFQDTMKPKMIKIAAAINKHLCPRYKAQGTYKVVFDMSEYLADDYKTRVEVLDKLLRIGVVNPNEIRKDLGIGAPIEGGNQYYVTQQVVPAGEETVERMDKAARGTSEQVEQLMEELRSKVDEKGVKGIIDDELGDNPE